MVTGKNPGYQKSKMKQAYGRFSTEMYMYHRPRAEGQNGLGLKQANDIIEDDARKFFSQKN